MFKNSCKSFFKTDLFLYCLIGIISAIVFTLYYGIRVLDPTYTSWLLRGGDPTQHYLGWIAYRQSPWHFPIGMIDTLIYPHQTSVMFTDSIPIFAVIFKLFSPILPETFQYFGYWGLFSFVMQGILTARILKNFSNNKITLIVASILLLFTPMFLVRMFEHSALTGQWLILLILEPLFNHKKYENNNKIYILCAITGFLGTSIHMYLVLMCGIVIVGICIYDILQNKKIKNSILMLLSYCGTIIVTTWILGGFSSGTGSGGTNLDDMGFNLNGLINPISTGISSLIEPLPTSSILQFEGFSYLGVGNMLLIVTALISFLLIKNKKIFLSNKLIFIISICFIAFVSFVVSLSPSITLNDKVLFKVNYPDFIINLWSTFRATGRVIWTTVYILLLLSIIMIIRAGKRLIPCILICLALILQMYDLRGFISSKHDFFGNEISHETVLNDDIWNSLAGDTSYDTVVYYSYSWITLNPMYEVAYWAITNNKYLNDFYLARSPHDLVEESTSNILSKLPSNCIYIFTDENRDVCSQYNLDYYEADGYIIGLSK